MPVSHIFHAQFIYLKNQLDAAYNTFSGHVLPFPLDGQAQEDNALALWTPPPNLFADTREDNPSVVKHLYEALGTPCGVAAVEFWGIFEKCNGCDVIVLTTKMKAHVCDLTGM